MTIPSIGIRETRQCSALVSHVCFPGMSQGCFEVKPSLLTIQTALNARQSLSSINCLRSLQPVDSLDFALSVENIIGSPNESVHSFLAWRRNRVQHRLLASNSLSKSVLSRLSVDGIKWRGSYRLDWYETLIFTILSILAFSNHVPMALFCTMHSVQVAF